MWLALLLILEWFSALYIFGHLWKHSPSIGLLVLGFLALWILTYILSYVDPSHRYGNRNWEWIRNRRFWRKLTHWWLPLTYHYQFHNFDPSKRYLFIVHPNPYNVSTMFGLGLHGGERTMTELNLLWMIPSLYLYVPILRDLLLWSGAVSQTMNGVIDLMNRGHSVAMCPDGNEDALRIKDDKLYVKMARDDIFQYATERSVAVVPVLIYGENELYTPVSRPWLDYFRQISISKLGIPWPNLTLGWCNTFLPKRKEIHMYIGTPVEARGRNSDIVKHEFYQMLHTLNSTDLDKPIELID